MKKRVVLRNRPAQGFTLLELMVSLGLTLTLVGVLFTAMDLHYRFSTTGTLDVERAQIARALLTRMSADIRSVVFRPPAPPPSDETESEDGFDDSGDESSTDDPPAEVVEAEYTSPADAFAGAGIGVFGDSQSLTLHISRPDRIESLPTANGDDIPLPQSDLKAVSYFLADGIGDLPGLVGDDVSGPNATGQLRGLARMSADRLAMDVLGDLGGSTAETELLAPEIEYLAFEYFDGFEWLSEWDSDVEERVPNAIGITIRFRIPDLPEGSILNREPSEMTDEFRLVVTLPVANSFEGLSF